MSRNVFVTQSPVPPARWLEAFPGALVAAALPADLAAGDIVWLHNGLPPGAGAARTAASCVVLHDAPSDDRGLAAIPAGASGYANAHATPELLRTIAAVVGNGGLWVGESLLARLARTVTQAMREPPAAKPALDKLSEREREVALRVARGASNKEVARELDIAERTVKAHLSAAFEKLGARDRLHLAIMLGARETAAAE